MTSVLSLEILFRKKKFLGGGFFVLVFQIIWYLKEYQMMYQADMSQNQKKQKLENKKKGKKNKTTIQIQES